MKLFYRRILILLYFRATGLGFYGTVNKNRKIKPNLKLRRLIGHLKNYFSFNIEITIFPI